MWHSYFCIILSDFLSMGIGIFHNFKKGNDVIGNIVVSSLISQIFLGATLVIFLWSIHNNQYFKYIIQKYCRGGKRIFSLPYWVPSWNRPLQQRTNEEDKSKKKFINLYTSFTRGRYPEKWICQRHGLEIRPKYHLQLKQRKKDMGQGAVMVRWPRKVW